MCSRRRRATLFARSATPTRQQTRLTDSSGTTQLIAAPAERQETASWRDLVAHRPSPLDVLVSPQPGHDGRRAVPSRPAHAWHRHAGRSSADRIRHDPDDARSSGLRRPSFEAIPPQVEESADAMRAVDWSRLLKLRRARSRDAGTGRPAVALARESRHARRVDRHLAGKHAAAARRSRGPARPARRLRS